MQNVQINGKKIKSAVIRSRFTKEQVVASVQDRGIRFSLAGLDRIYRNELPVFSQKEILEAIAEKCRCKLSDFAELESLSA